MERDLPREISMKLPQRRQELRLRIEYSDNVSVSSSANIAGRGAWNLSMQIQHQVVLLHGLEDRVIALVIEHAGFRVRGHARRVDLDACDSGACGLGDGGRGDRLVQIERHQELDIRSKCLKTFTVGDCSSHSGNWRDEVGLY